MSSANTFSVNDAEFQEKVLNSDTPVLVDFWADWCGPCKSIAPFLDTLAQEQAEKVKIVKVNVDENQLSPAKYGVRGIPTFILFQNGEKVDTVVGANPVQIRNLVESAPALA